VFAIALAATLSSSGGADRKGEEDNDEADDGEGAFLDHDYQAHASAPKRKGGDYGYGAVGLDESAADPDSTPLAGSGVPRSSPQRKGACARLCSGRCGCLLRWVGIVFSLVVVGALWTSFGFIVSVHLRSLPRIDGELRLPGLIGRVTVTREHANTIHIFAERTDDLYFAQGVVAAQERLWQLEFQRRVVTGTLASKVGEAAIETDELMRTLGLYRDAAALFPLLSPAASAALTAYTNGVNTYIAEVKPRPFEFFLLGYHPEPFEPAELLAWGKVLSLDLSLNMMDELQRFQWLTERNMTCERIAELMQPYDTSRFPTVLSSLDVTYPPSNSSSGNHSCANEPVVQWLAQQRALGRWPRAAPLHPGFAKLRSLLGPSFFAARASNNWVVHGSRTASGKPLLANDPHLQLMAPSIWMVVHLQVGNSSITGASLPGLPSIVIGYNDHLAWGITNVGADVQDLYIMEEPEGNSSVYLLNGQWTPYAVREEVIDVKGSHARVLQVRKSVFGPVITGVFRDAYKGQVPLSLQWTTLSSNDTTVESFFLFSTATSYSEFRQAQRFFLAPVSNVVYADVDGNIAYTMAGQVPRRIANHSGLFPVPGSTSTYAWRSMIEFEYMPVSLNPPEGFLVTANNQVTPPDWPDDYRIALDWDSG
jgi:penicillin amidase